MTKHDMLGNLFCSSAHSVLVPLGQRNMHMMESFCFCVPQIKAECWDALSVSEFSKGACFMDVPTASFINEEFQILCEF